MIQIKAESYSGSPEHPLPIGRLGENLVRTIVFDINALRDEAGGFGDGTWDIVALRPTERLAYSVSEKWESVEGYACWDVTDTDVAINGQGRVELRYYPVADDTSIYKSRLWVTNIEYALGTNNGSPSPYDDIIESIRDYSAIATRKSEEATEAATSAASSEMVATEKAALAVEKAGAAVDASVAADASAQNAAESLATVERLKQSTEQSAYEAAQKAVDASDSSAAAKSSETKAKEYMDAAQTAVDTANADIIVAAKLAEDARTLANKLMNQKGYPNGLASLDDTGKVPAAQLPSYVDDVLEYDSVSDFPKTGETGKIYIDMSSNLTYRWSGSTYVLIKSDISLGETASTAFPGDKGKAAYDHAVTNKGTAVGTGFYKLITNSEGHVIDYVEVTKADVLALGIVNTEDITDLIPIHYEDWKKLTLEERRGKVYFIVDVEGESIKITVELTNEIDSVPSNFAVKNVIDTLKNLIEANSDSIEELLTAKEGFEQSIDDLETDVSNLQAADVTMNAAIGDLQASDVTMNAAIGGLQDAINAAIGNLQAADETMSESIENIQNELETVMKKAMFSLDGTILTITTNS